MSSKRVSMGKIFDGEHEIVAYKNYDGMGFQISRQVDLNAQARFACACIERWGMVAAADGGEDSTGRAKLRRMKPDEIAITACDTAAAAFAEFEKRGWLAPLPDLAQVEEALLNGKEEN